MYATDWTTTKAGVISENMFTNSKLKGDTTKGWKSANTSENGCFTKPYTVTLDPNTGTPGTVTAIYNVRDGQDIADITGEGALPTREGFKFAGYYKDVDDETTKYFNADGTHAKDKWDLSNDTTLYAKWKTVQNLKFGEESITKTYGEAPFTNTLSGAMTSPVTYESLDPSVASVNSSGQVSINNAGSTTIKATAPEDDTYAEATTSFTLTVAQKEVIVMAEDKSKTYGTAEPDLTATVTGTLGPDTIEYSITRSEGEQVGCYTITPAGDTSQGNYSVVYQKGNFEITSDPKSSVKVDTEALKQIKKQYQLENPNSGITVNMEVTPGKANEKDVAKIKKVVGNKNLWSVDARLVVKVDGKEVTDAGDKNDIPVAIQYNFDYNNKTDFQTYRAHNGGNPEEITQVDTDGEFAVYDTQDSTVTITAKKYSTYSVAYNDVVAPTPAPDNSSSNGSYASQTGDSAGMLSLGLFGIIILAAGVTFFARRRYLNTHPSVNLSFCKNLLKLVTGYCLVTRCSSTNQTFLHGRGFLLKARTDHYDAII